MRSQPHKTLLSISVALVFLVAMVFGYMKNSLDTSMTNVIDLRSRIKSENMIRSEGRFLAALASDTASDRSSLRSHVVSSDKAVDLIVAIEALGPKSGSKVTIVDPVSDQTASSTGSISLGVTSVGSWSSVIRARSLAESLPYVTTIDSVRLEVLSKNGWNLNFKLRALTI